MAKELKIVRLGDPVLRQVCRPVGDSRKKQPLIAAMIDRLAAADGFGLAAPQVGRSERLFVMVANPDEFRQNKQKPVFAAVINPRLVYLSEEQSESWEGCLSIPGLMGKVCRPEKIKVEYVSREGEKIKRKLAGLAARIFQHEYDHLEGRLFLDRVEGLKI